MALSRVFFYSFFPFETPFFFLPWRGKKEKKQLGKQSPSAEPWLLACRCCCDFGNAGWGPVTKKWRETERSLTPRALCPCPYTPVSVSLSLCSLSPFLSPFSRPSSSPTPIPVVSGPDSTGARGLPCPCPRQPPALGPTSPTFSLSSHLCLAFKFIMPFIARDWVHYSIAQETGMVQAGKGTQYGCH